MSLFNITFSNLQIIKFSFILFMFFVHLYILILFWCNKDISNYEQIKSDIRYSGIIDINFLKKNRRLFIIGWWCLFFCYNYSRLR